MRTYNAWILHVQNMLLSILMQVPLPSDDSWRQYGQSKFPNDTKAGGRYVHKPNKKYKGWLKYRNSGQNYGDHTSSDLTGPIMEENKLQY